MRFIGRDRSLVAPAALDRGARLSDREGPVLDPVICIRHVIVLQPDENESVGIDMVTGVAESRAEASPRPLIEKYFDARLADRVFELAWTHSHIMLQQLNAHLEAGWPGGTPSSPVR